MVEGTDTGHVPGWRPDGICDCHAHVFPSDAAVAPGARYAPPFAPLSDYAALCTRLGIARSVFVTPSVYGTDNSTMLDALAVGGARARGIATLAPGVGVATLQDLVSRGVAGVRLPVALSGPLRARDVTEWSERLAVCPPLHLDILLGSIAEIEALALQIEASNVPVVIDHLGRTRAGEGADHAGFGVLLDLVRRTDHVWVKLSSWYRLSAQAAPHADMAPIVRRLVAARPDRLLWGSNWPHAHFSGPAVDDAALLDDACGWLGDRATVQAVLVDNPRRLYGFDP